MQTIATRAGVSLMTVSRALKNHPSIPSATCERIRKIADTLGYRPNPMVSALMAQLRSGKPAQSAPTLAFLSNHTDAVFNEWSHLVDLHEGAVARAAELGYKLERFTLTEPGMTPARMRGLLRARGIPGIILDPLPLHAPELEFDWTDFACASVGYSYKTVKLHRAVNDHFLTVSMAVRHLTELGYVRIGFAIRHEDNDHAENRLAGGIMSFHPAQPARARIPIFFWSDDHEKGFPEWYRRWQPDVVVTLHPLVMTWLRGMGLRVPRDVGLASLNIQSNHANYSGIDQNNRHIGATALELLVEQIHHNEHGIPREPKTVMTTGRWVDGVTTRKRAPRIAA
ncbi:LacI family transcriptional regulator [Opitutaceae bacterium TAV4]|nr:LacI family transcriptional regulator [Opitutaceae bacterium TAV4]RRK01257.1 LacI family transcriptional regulator [Opitutaceae bacterium TAV3]